jgi:hypothetical protein
LGCTRASPAEATSGIIEAIGGIVTNTAVLLIDTAAKHAEAVRAVGEHVQYTVTEGVDVLAGAFSIGYGKHGIMDGVVEVKSGNKASRRGGATSRGELDGLMCFAGMSAGKRESRRAGGHDAERAERLSLQRAGMPEG